MQANRMSYFQISEHKAIKIHEFLFIKHKYAHLFIIFAIYALVIIIWGEDLGVSSNYFIFLPLIAVSVIFGTLGGFIAGTLALPANLFFFFIIGHNEYSPESKIITEIFGILVGTVLGYVSDFFLLMKKEIELRRISEIALEKTLKEKDILLKEINHRVKNNLSLIKSIIQLQSNRIRHKKSKEELIKLNQRIISIAMVQDLLFSQESLDMLDFRSYMKDLIEKLLLSYVEISINLELDLGEKPLFLESEKITSLGLIINEAVTNAIKYAYEKNKSPLLSVRLTQSEGSFHLAIKDNGPGYPEENEEIGLGLKLIKSLTVHLNGTVMFQNNKGGEIVLNIPIEEAFDEMY